MIEVQALRKSFGKLVAVDNVNIKIARGEAFGLLGPNGAGKTTTINMLIGITDPDSGDVRIDGNSPSIADTRRVLGLAPQALSLYEELSGEENLSFFGRLYQINGRELKDRVDWALDFAGLTDRARDRVAVYSGGMKRRLNLACALIHEPKVVLMDEPTVGVDPQSRNHLFECIDDLKKQGLTIIYTTHYMEEAERLCDRVAIMDHGKILANDRVDRLIQDFGGQSVIKAELQNAHQVTARLPGSLEGDDWRVESTQPMQDIASATDQGIKFHSLQITTPDLESVFLSLTGRSLRD